MNPPPYARPERFEIGPVLRSSGYSLARFISPEPARSVAVLGPTPTPIERLSGNSKPLFRKFSERTVAGLFRRIDRSCQPSAVSNRNISGWLLCAHMAGIGFSYRCHEVAFSRLCPPGETAESNSRCPKAILAEALLRNLRQFVS